MNQLFKMAFRDLGRNRRRSFFSALALGMGLALLLLMASVITGEMESSMESSIRLQSGHLQIRAANYIEARSSLTWEDLVVDPAQIAAQVAALAPVKVATPRLYISGIISVSDENRGVRVIGIDPASAANAPYRDGMLSGTFLTADDRDGILIGKPLAEILELKAGDKANLLVNTSNGDVDQQLFTIRGIYTTNITGYDQITVFMPLAKAQTITKTENHASILFILLKDREQTGAVVAAIQPGGYEVKTWIQLNDLIVQIEDLSNSYMILLYLIILGITATVIVNTFIMAVFERTREIGILAAMGMHSRRIMAMFFAESSLLAVGGIVIGLIIGGLLVAYFTQYGFFIGNMGLNGAMIGDTIYAHLTLKDVLTLTSLTFVVSLLAALYPALLAAQMEPVEALRGGK